MLFLVDQAFYQAAAQKRAFYPNHKIMSEIINLSILTVLNVSYKMNSSLAMKPSGLADSSEPLLTIL